MEVDPEGVGHEPAARLDPRPGLRVARGEGARAGSASARAMPSSMFVVKYSVPVAGMMSTWNAIPERSSIVEPGEIGELTHSSRWIW